MKRGCIITILGLMLILILPASLAQVEFDELKKNEFNLGDKFQVSGTVEMDRAVEGFLILNMVCKDETFPLQLPIPITLYANEEKSFPEQINVPEINIKDSMLGSCFVEMQLKEDGVIVDEGNSEIFEITKELRGTFSIEQTLIQVGKNVNVNGIVQKMDGTPINGKADVYFNDGVTSYPVPPRIDVVNGVINFENTIEAIPAGDYNVEIIVSDEDNNEQKFKAAKFTLTNQLNIMADTNKYEYVPGQEVSIEGEVRNVLHEPVELASAYVELDGQQFSAEIQNNEIIKSINLPEDIKSGKHTIIIKVRDNLGNKGTMEKDIYVTPIATRLDIDFLVNNYEPGNKAVMDVAVYDQTSDLISDYVKVKFYNPDDDLIATKDILSGSQEEFTFPKYAMPGEWLVKTQYWDLEKEKVLTVEEIKDFTAKITGQVVTIKNEGNVENKEPIKLNLHGEEGDFTIYSKENINPGETVDIELKKNAPSGIYTLAVFEPNGKEEEFDSVVITDGKAIKNLNTIFSLLVLMVVGMIIFMTVTINKKKMTPKLSNRDLSKLSKNTKTQYKQVKDTERERKEAIDDFKRVTLDEIRKTESANKKNKFSFNRQEPQWIRPKPRPEAPKKEEKKDENASGAANFFKGF